MIKLRYYEGPDVEDQLVAEVESPAVPRPGDMVSFTFAMPRDVHRYIVRGAEYAYLVENDEGRASNELECVWVLVEPVPRLTRE